MIMADILCKFYKKCELFRKDSFTCTHGGGDYCGRYRDNLDNMYKRIRKLTIITSIFTLILTISILIFMSI